MIRYILDGCCGEGGASRGFADAGWTPVGVDIVDRPEYPYDFIQADVLELLRDLLAGRSTGTSREGRQYLLGHFEGVHASPPCPRYAGITRVSGDPESHPDLVAPIRDLLTKTLLPYVIENVPGAPLLNPVQLCGSSFGLAVRRHRLFETNWPLMGLPCAHHLQQERKYPPTRTGRTLGATVVSVHGNGGGPAKDKELWATAMDIDWMSKKGLAQAIPPAFTKYIGERLMEHLTMECAA